MEATSSRKGFGSDENTSFYIWLARATALVLVECFVSKELMGEFPINTIQL